MFGIIDELAFHRFHQKNLEIIEEINAQYRVHSGLRGIISNRKASKALKKQVNVRAAQYGVKYDLQGRFMNMSSLQMEFEPQN